MALQGATICFPHPTFNVNKSLEAVRNEKLNVWMGTPTMYVDLLNAPENDMKGLNAFAFFDVEAQLLSFVNNSFFEVFIPKKSCELTNGRAIMGGALCPPELMRNCRTKFKVNC